MQLALTRHNDEDLLPILVIPLLTLPSMAILIHSDRADLAPRRPPLHGLLLAPVGVVLLSASTFCLSVFFGALAGAVPALRNILINLLTTAIIAFCGVSVPVSFWPTPVQWIAEIMPCTHGVAAIRLMMANCPTVAVLCELGKEIAVAAPWLLCSSRWMASRSHEDRCVRSGRRAISMDHKRRWLSKKNSWSLNPSSYGRILEEFRVKLKIAGPLLRATALCAIIPPWTSRR